MFTKRTLSNLPNKELRAEVIKDFYGPEQRLYCFSDGNSTKALREAGLNVVSIDKQSAIKAPDFVNYKESNFIFNGVNVTSGCLPTFLIEKIADRFFEYLELPEGTKMFVPVGSGETILALAYHFDVIGYTGADSCIKLEMTPLEKLIRRQFRLYESPLFYRDLVKELIQHRAPEWDVPAVVYNSKGTGGEIDL